MRMDYVDGIMPPSIRSAAETRKVKRDYERRSRGDYDVRMPKRSARTSTAGPIEETEAWAIYQDQRARGLDLEED